MPKHFVQLLSILFIQLLILLSIARKESPYASQPPPYPQQAGIQSAVGNRERQGPSLNAHAYLVRLIGDESFLFSQRAEKPLPPASLTKFVTAIIAREMLDLEELIFFSEDAKRVEEKKSDVGEGEALRRDDAIRLMLVSSANDAAVALAEAAGKKKGGKMFRERMEIFLSLMEEKAQRIGISSATFRNPTGLDEDGHLMSAEDLAKIAEYIWYVHPALWEMSRMIQTDIPSDRKIYTVANTNELLGKFPGILGGKTGMTDNAEGALLLLYPVRPNRVAIIVLLGSEDRFGDGRKVIKWLEHTF